MAKVGGRSVVSGEEENLKRHHATLIIVMGVSGTGKSTLGKALSKALDMPFVDGDSLHPKANIEKMSAGHPLTDTDREPWLELIRTRAEHMCAERAIDPTSHTRSGVLIACSALKKYYRDILRGRVKPRSVPDHLDPPDPNVLRTYFVFLQGSRETLVDRMGKRDGDGHFMKSNMLESQLNTLEDPSGEDGVVVVPIALTTGEQIELAKEGLNEMAGPVWSDS